MSSLQCHNNFRVSFTVLFYYDPNGFPLNVSRPLSNTRVIKLKKLGVFGVTDRTSVGTGVGAQKTQERTLSVNGGRKDPCGQDGRWKVLVKIKTNFATSHTKEPQTGRHGEYFVVRCRRNSVGVEHGGGLIVEPPTRTYVNIDQ